MAAQSLLLRDACSVTASPPIKLQLPACRCIHVFMHVFRSKVSPKTFENYSGNSSIMAMQAVNYSSSSRIYGFNIYYSDSM